MKKTISVSIPEEKLTALRMYMGQKNFSLEDELSKYAEQLYNKHVPQNVREYIAMTTGEAPEPKRRAVTDNNGGKND